MRDILIHGLGQDHTSWDKVKEGLKETKPDMICPNLFDFLQKDAYDYKTLYENFASQVNQGKDRVNLCGLSLGGLLALDYAKQYPERVASLILIGVPYKIPKVLFRLQLLAFRLMPKSRFIKLGFTKEGFIGLLESMKDLEIDGEIEKVNCKSLLLCGEKDTFNKTSSRLFHKRMKNSELKIIRNAGHEVNIENPEALAQVIRETFK
ncbi:hydrolase, alpha/beta domain protein [Peptoniphilus sp. oral taxon 375 str. F0436]|nr:hydrolase, alpha/beta domain protein [Peptoniphilus sp. oral taxon 375 str. F0436]